MYTAQQLVNMGYYGYAGWGDAEADADFKATNGAGKGGPSSSGPASNGDPEMSADQTILKAFQDLQTETNKKITEYTSKNPFKLDEILAEKRKQAGEQLDPYYNETLGDYLTGIQRKISRSTQDTQDLLGELRATSDSFTGTTKLRLDEALNKSAQGFAEAGLFESGQRFRQEGLLQRETQDTLSDFNRRQDLRTKQTQTGQARNLEDIALGKKMDVRNIERERQTGIETLAGQLTKEAGQKYTSGLYASLPPEYQGNQSFDILKQIGIYD